MSWRGYLFLALICLLLLALFLVNPVVGLLGWFVVLAIGVWQNRFAFDHH
jgi:hypothetical protein